MLKLENALFTATVLIYVASMILYFLFIAVKRDRIAKIAIFVQMAGLLLHTVALVCRGIGAGRLPMTNQYEFATSFAWGLSLVSLIFILRFKFPMLGAFASPVTILVIGYAALQSRKLKSALALHDKLNHFTQKKRISVCRDVLFCAVLRHCFDDGVKPLITRPRRHNLILPA